MADSRIFTDKEGRNVEAEIIRFDAQKGEVTIKRMDTGRSVTVPVDVFSQQDHDYIEDWAQCQDIMDSRLKADISRLNKQDLENSHATSASTEVFTDHRFKIEFNNGTTTSLEDIDLEYVIYYEQELHTNHGYGVEKKEGTLYQKQKISLPAKKTTEFITDQIKLYTWNTYSLKPIGAKVQGIRIHLTLTSEAGSKVTREYTYPKGFDSAWTDKTNNAQKRVRNK